MKFQPTRPQIQREYSYLRLYLRSLPARTHTALAAHKKAALLVVGTGLFLLALSVAVIQLSTDITRSSDVAASAPATQPLVAPAPVDAEPAPEPEQPITPVPVPVPVPVPPNPPAPKRKVHVVVHGETLAEVALEHEVPVEQIAADNAITNPDRVDSGRQLLITACPPGTKVIAAGATLEYYARYFGVTVEHLMALNPRITDSGRIEAGSGLRVR